MVIDVCFTLRHLSIPAVEMAKGPFHISPLISRSLETRSVTRFCCNIYQARRPSLITFPNTLNGVENRTPSDEPKTWKKTEK